jgi:hypothetical protein
LAREQVADGGGGAGAGENARAAHWQVVTIMTPLAHGLEIFIGAIFRLMVEVRGGQHDKAIRDRVTVGVPCVTPPRMVDAALAAALASATGALESDALADCLPVLRVACPVFNSDRHYPHASTGVSLWTAMLA